MYVYKVKKNMNNYILKEFMYAHRVKKTTYVGMYNICMYMICF